MRLPNRDLILKFSPILISLFFLILLAISTPIYLSQNKSTSPKTDNPKTSNSQPEIKNNQIEIEKENSVQGVIDKSENGTCKVTRNGVVEIVPSNKVDVNEKSSGDINVKVECNNSSSTTNTEGSNKTTIKNDIKVKVNSSN